MNTIIKRLAALTHIDRDGCWTWLGSHVGHYGRSQSGGRKVMTHRLSYETFVGQIPPGMTIDHICRNKLCLNPEHLEAVSATENVRRSQSRSECRRCGGKLARVGRNTKCHACARGYNKKYRQRVSAGNVTRPTRDRAVCPAGHAYTNDNTYVTPSNGGRHCRECLRNRDAIRKGRDRESVLSVRDRLRPTPEMASILMTKALAARPAQGKEATDG